VNADGARYCGACGAALPVRVREGLEVRKTVTILFCDVVGSTSLGEATDPETTRRVMTRYAEAMAEIVRQHGGTVERSRARQVVVCGGTIGSAQLLLLSGVGPADHLRSVGVDVVADVPGVGANLHDHLLSPVIFGAEREVGPPSPGLPACQTHLFWRSRPGLPVPDLQPIHFMFPMYEDWMEGPENGFTLMGGMVRPVSRGTLQLTGPTPEDPVALDPNVLACEADLECLVAAVELCRRIGAADALSDWGATEQYPGPSVDTPDALRAYVRRTAITYHHQVGTCKMGTDAEAVVDPRLRVHGIDGLRVADASIMPTVTTGNTNAPSIMIGERAAEFVLADG